MSSCFCLGFSRYSRLSLKVITTVLMTSLLSSGLGWQQFAEAQTTLYCRLTNEAIAEKDLLRQEMLSGDDNAKEAYRDLIADHAEQLRDCREQNWPSEQAIWIRLYPCDARPGEIEQLLDHVVNKGYNQVYIETFFNGQVLLPSAENTTPWPSVIRSAGYENKDLLAEAIAAGHERGLEVYAWMFTMNFGYTYGQRPDRQQALALNGDGKTSFQIGSTASNGSVTSEETFIDPYSDIAKRDYYDMAQAIAERQPDGMLFDYIRYPKGTGGDSIAHQVEDLWIYGSASRQALENRALNQRGRELIRRFVSQGYITANDIEMAKSLYPDETEPQWQGRTASSSITASAGDLQPLLQQELWYLSVAHAIQGILDFLAVATLAPQQQGIAHVGTIFFPEGNQTIGAGYDSRLQPWDRFPSNLERHPMAYAVCGNASCIVDQIKQVMTQSPAETEIKPVLAGAWGTVISNHPTLEAQMQAIHRAVPEIDSVSHFAFSWQEPEADRNRKSCQLRPL